MNATASAVARIAGVAIVLILAAAIGLIAGTALNARDDGGAGIGAAQPHMGSFDGARYAPVQRDAATIETPSYADPYRQLIEQAAAGAADDTFTQTWGNLDERRDAPSSDETSAGESLTAPTLR